MNQSIALDAYRDAIAKGYLPIRQVAALTGVNPVTLRAWERRYGLVVPHRTSKGHRLYSPDQVQTIQDVLGWLNRGVSVGQVKGLLHANQPLSVEQASRWQNRCRQMLDAIEQLQERKLDEAFNAELSLYPPLILCQQLLLPVLQSLEQRWLSEHGRQTERLFFYSWLRSKLGARVYHDNRLHQGAPLLLINVDNVPLSPQLWLCAWLIGTAGCRVEAFDAAIPAPELAQAVTRLQPRAVLLFCTAARRETLHPLLDQLQPPCLLVGPQPHDEMLTHTDLSTVPDVLAALQLLADRHLLE